MWIILGQNWYTCDDSFVMSVFQKRDQDDGDDDLVIAIDNTAFMDEFFAEVRRGIKNAPNV